MEIPAWRHAMISYPHPLLKSGLIVLDTPGLNALGTEPELTLSMIPNAHAVLFLLAMDTGVTKSDLDVWQKYVQPAATRRIAVLNKIDLMWDDLKSDADIAVDVERQLEQTSALLALPRTHVIGDFRAESAARAGARRQRVARQERHRTARISARVRDHPRQAGNPARRRAARNRQHGRCVARRGRQPAGGDDDRIKGTRRDVRQEPQHGAGDGRAAGSRPQELPRHRANVPRDAQTP